METAAETQSQTSRRAWGVLWKSGGIEQARVVKDSIGGSTEPTNLGPWGSQSLHMGPLTSGTGAVSDSVACHWIPFPNQNDLLGLSGRDA